ncbi:MAG: MmcQ/YjbR family DNA-binding protein [Pseudomonadota bacterium]
MTETEIEAACMALPGSYRVIQWMGAHVYKIDEKMYAIWGDRTGLLTIKCADVETAEMLLEVGAAQPAPHLPRGGWVAIKPGDFADDEVRERLRTSYLTVRASLSKSKQAALPPVD